MKKTLAMVGIMGLAATVMFTGCSDNKTETSPSSDTSGSSAPVDPASPSAKVEVPASVVGAKWCAPTYKTYLGEAATPDAAAEQLVASSQLAKEEGKDKAAGNLTAMADFLKQAGASPSLSEEQLATFQTLDTAVGESFKEDCGGKTLAEVSQEQQPTGDATGATPEGQQ